MAYLEDQHLRSVKAKDLAQCQLSPLTSKCSFKAVKGNEPSLKNCYLCTLKTLREAIDRGQVSTVGMTIAALYSFAEKTSVFPPS